MRDYSKTGGKKGLPAYRTPSSFEAKIYKIVRGIPSGKTLTYKQVAKLSGSPQAYRAVGNILNKNRDQNVPCHRVIRSDGKTGGYNRGAPQKQKILKSEGAIK
jgi:methylated-DNA-[protein]-cysteine S-methyltransferase